MQYPMVHRMGHAMSTRCLHDDEEKNSSGVEECRYRNKIAEGFFNGSMWIWNAKSEY